jgi:ribose-phosphate pyrophosphokinase
VPETTGILSDLVQLFGGEFDSKLIELIFRVADVLIERRLGEQQSLSKKYDKLKIISGNSNRTLANKICNYLGISLGNAEIGEFSDGEIKVEIEDDMRETDAFVIQSGAYPINKNLMELLIILDALKRASAGRITAVIPYYGYARQDRKNRPRVAITARLVADLITAAGADRVLTMELHAGQIQGFFNIPVDNLYTSPILLPHIKKINNGNLVIVSPDAGGMVRA